MCRFRANVISFGFVWQNIIGMKAVFQLLAILLTINLTWAASSLLDKIKDDPDLSQVIDFNVRISS